MSTYLKVLKAQGTLKLLFINNSAETFTPTRSGALATIIWECCRVAENQGFLPHVISRSCEAAPYPWQSTTLVDYPRIPTGIFCTSVLRAERKLTGWRYLRQREFSHRVIKSVRALDAGSWNAVLINDPEMAVILRRHFPKMRIIHWFQNQHTSKPGFREEFGRCVDVVLGVSDFISRWIEGYYKLPPGKVRTVYNGVDVEQFHPAAHRPEGPAVINFVGRTGIEKAPDLLLKACLRLSEQTNDFAVQILGSNHWDRFEMDPYQQELLALAEKLESRGVRVRRPGHISRAALPDELRRADIHVTPSRWDEPFGLTTLEAMASGLTTFASRTGGTPEVLGDGGFLFERDSVEELADLLAKVVMNPECRSKLSARARHRAETLTWNKTWAEIAAAMGH